mmetsp:Transcript_20022/g.49825  ORF Transcript_20022/g.49825 Transcript_20022/m.49825 type:complete len:482 (+) Transcript_20022:245-1690(+)
MSLGHELSTHLNDWHKVSQCISAYGAYVALWAVLSAMTVYRREISCNRAYHEDDEDETFGNGTDYNKKTSATPTTISSRTDETELMAEALLEGAGMYCSGRPILNFAELLCLGFDGYDNRDNNETTSGNDMSPEDLLEHVGNYASPEPILATIACFMIWRKAERIKSLSSPLSPQKSPPSSLPLKKYGSDPFMREIPPDVHVQIASFLHPRDVVNLACVSKAYHKITSDSNNLTCSAIWKTLWHRDYAWIVFKWKVGKLAFERSKCTQLSYDKDFYFLFGQSYLDYVLAGRNTFNSCLVGIHSNIYDISLFLFSHPGSPDTLMVHSGRDATDFFDDMGHSTGARKLAMSMCVVVNRSAQRGNNECGLFPTHHTVVDDDETHPLPQRLPDGEDNLLNVRRRRTPAKKVKNNNRVSNGGGTLHQMRARFIEEREEVRNRNTRIYSGDPTILGHEVNTYFDPFTRQWRIWYTDTDLRTIFLPAS